MEKFFKRPWLIVAGIAVITVFFAAQLPKARMNNNMNAFLPDTIPERIIARHFEEEYGDKIMIVVGLERPYGTIFDRAFLSRIREFTTIIEESALVDSINSIMSTQYITSDRESIIVTDLVGADFSGAGEEIAELKRRLDSWDIYRSSIISDDLSATQITVTLNAVSKEAGDPDVVATLMHIRDLAKEMFAGLAEVYTAGEPVVTASMDEAAFADLGFLVPLVMVVLLGVLIFSFRRAAFVLLPMLTVLVVVIWTVGAMPLCNITMTMLAMIMPIILTAVGSAYAIHIVSHYKDEMGERGGGEVSPSLQPASGGLTLPPLRGLRPRNAPAFTVEEHRAFVLAIVRKMRKPVILAALTTFAGFISFCFGPLAPIRNFGFFAGFGVIAAVAVALTLVPALLIIRGPRSAQAAGKKDKPKKQRPFNFEHKLAAAMTAFAQKKSLVLFITAVIIAGSTVGASKVIVDTSLVEFFNDDSEVSRSDRFIREKFGGSAPLIVSVEAGDTQTLLSPEVLGALDGLCVYLDERVPLVGKLARQCMLTRPILPLISANLLLKAACANSPGARRTAWGRWM